jgi:hypothetical protein
MDVRISIDTRDVKDALAALRREGPKAVADAINRTMFEIRDAAQIEVASSFAFSGPNTQRFLSKSFRFEGAKPDKLSATLYALPGSRTILERQQFGDVVKVGEKDVGPALDAKLAIPQDVKRTASGRVPVARLPSRLLRRTKKGRSRAYVAGRAVFERVPGQQLGRFLFALATQARIKPRLDFFGVMERTAKRELPKKAARVLEKINLRRSR